MTMPFKLSLNSSSSIVLSAILHGGAFLLALNLAAPSLSPLPVGVELMYGEEAAPTSQVQTAVAQTKTAAPQVFDDEGVAIEEKKKKKKEKPVEEPPQQVASAKTLGSPLGTSTQGALIGREGVANGSEVTPEERYLYEIKKLLERRKKYPVMARRMGHSGKVMMKFTIQADGSLAQSEILQSTPYESLNNAAVELVKGIDGLKPFPKEIAKAHWEITVPIEFALN